MRRRSAKIACDARLVGGLYGVAIGGLFAAESKFHRVRDASKVALVRLVAELRAGERPGERILDVQWRSEHLASLGVIEIPRRGMTGKNSADIRLVVDAIDLAY